VIQNSLSEELISFLNDFGNLILPGSTNPYVPRWDVVPPSEYFLFEVAKSVMVIELFNIYLGNKFNGTVKELTEEDLKAIILENSTATKDFFRSIGELYLQDYYSRPKTLSVLGLSQVPPFPAGNNVFLGDLEKLEMVFSRGRIYR
jgi:hypothetical protein